MHNVVYLPGPNIVRYQIAGFWDLTTVDVFAATLISEIRRHGAGRKFDVLGDASAFAVQTSAVTTAFEEVMMTKVFPYVDRLALVVASALNKLQVERARAGDKMRVFTSETEAMKWLASKHQ